MLTLMRELITLRQLVLAPLFLFLAACHQFAALLNPDHLVVIEASGASREDIAASGPHIAKRLEAIGLGVSQITLREDNRVQFVVSGARGKSRIARVLGAPGAVEVRLIDPELTAEELEAGKTPPGRMIFPMADESGFVAVHRLGGLTGTRTIAATATRDEETFQPLVMIVFDPENRRKIAMFAPRNIKRPVAIILDGEMLEKVMVPELWHDHRLAIPGGSTLRSAEDLAVVLNQDPMPTAFEVVSFDRTSNSQ